MMHMSAPEDHLDALLAGASQPLDQRVEMEECAALAGEASVELERRARAGVEEPASAQGSLL